MPALTFDGDRFLLSTERRDGLNTTGFQYDRMSGEYVCRSPRRALRFRQFADSRAEKELQNKMVIVETPAPLPEPPAGLKYKPYQLEPIIFALSRNKSYIALDPGLGKTIVAAGVISAQQGFCVYLCPPFLLEDVAEKLSAWLPDRVITLWSSKGPDLERTDILLFPDSLLAKEGATDLMRTVRRMNGDRLAILVIDEAHRYNNDSTRTRVLYGGTRKQGKAFKKYPGLTTFFNRKVLLSGTPMPASPINLFECLNNLAPETIDFRDRFEYGKRYCAAFPKGKFGRNFNSWDYTGASNVKELGARVIHPAGPFMYRLKKSMVDLPEKIEELFIISGDTSPRLASLDVAIGKRYEKSSDILKSLIAEAFKKDLHVAEYRRLLGMEKIKPAVEYLLSILEETKEKIIVFAHHKDVIAGIIKGLQKYHPLMITGEVDKSKRLPLVKLFQEKSLKHRLIVGNGAMGVGLTLTEAHRVVHVEYDWTPGVIDQASDRAHRIGLEHTLLVQYMVYKNSLDKRILEQVLRKREAIKELESERKSG